MNAHQPPVPESFRVTGKEPIGFTEFVALVASLMALTALGIDAMLPALPAIGESLGVATDNDRQWVIGAFLLGFGGGQLLHGPLSDRFGRKPILASALLAYAMLNAVAAFSDSFTLLLVARAAAGVAIAASRVVTVALVRDRFSGRAMARVMSLAFMVFMAVPVLAPLLGQAVLLIGSWRLIFGALALLGAAVCAWFWLRMPETLAAENRLPLSAGRLASGWGYTLSERQSLGYTIAATMMLGGLYGFLNSVQQILYDVFRAPELLVPVFAAVAAAMAVASLLNSRIVERYGMRRIGHIALIGLVALAAGHLLLIVSGFESLVSFIVLQSLMMACFGLASSNFSALAMEKMGHMAGTASSVQGFIVTFGAAIIGAVIGQSFDGTTIPLYAGFLIGGLLALAAVLFTEHGRLFSRQL